MSSQKSYHQFSENANNRRNIFRSLSISPHEESSKLIIILVGLPARGKSYISHKLSNFLNWRGHSCRVFNVGQYRRTEMSDEPRQNADFFSDKNSKNVEKRNIIALKVLEVAITWLNNKNGQSFRQFF
ncbi:hypothetical protein MHBO_000627 [Bonamia ostreae]|uniref:6-phosphofructo-2-kinase domain-containing protein n=1 Tax=Bonamia ostreae TaxID=126728 RepID=A0ABV2AG91_9EUKA